MARKIIITVVLPGTSVLFAVAGWQAWLSGLALLEEHRVFITNHTVACYLASRVL